MLKRQILTLTFATALMALTACSGKGNHYNADASDRFVKQAATSDRFEITASKLALQKSRNPKVIKFAKDMIREHNKSTAELRQAVAASNINMNFIPEKMTPDQKEKIDELKQTSSGRSFDKEYMELQRDAHSDAVRQFRHYAQYGNNAELREYAQNTLRAIEHHEQRAYSIEP